MHERQMKQCGKKRRYFTEAAAKLGCDKTLNRNNPRHTPPKRPGPLVPYLCPYCGFWHIGHNRRETP